MNPLIPEIAAVIVRYGNGSCRIIIVKPWKQSQVDKGLKSIADPNGKFSVIDKCQKMASELGIELNK